MEKAAERLAASVELLRSFAHLDIDQATCPHFEKLRQEKGTRQMKRGDMLIACVALAHGAILVTRNVDDFKAVKGLRVENWAE